MQILIYVANNPIYNKILNFFSPKIPAYKRFETNNLASFDFFGRRGTASPAAAQSSNALGSAPAPARRRLRLRPARRRHGSATQLPAPSRPPGLAITGPGPASPSYDLGHV